MAGVAVALYAGWVIHDVGSSGPDVAAPARPTHSASASVTASPEPAAPPGLGPFRKAVGNARALLVVGDSTGDEPGEWVDLWAQDLGHQRKVVLHRWDEGTQAFVTLAVYGNGQPLDVWNLSYPGVRADYAQHVSEVSQEPDAVLVSVGHDRGPQQLRRALRSTGTAITKRWGAVPTAWVLQNPSTGGKAKAQERAVAYVRSLATKDRVPVIDVHAAFGKAGDLPGLLADESRPNGDGSRLWADAVERAVTG